MKMPKIRLWANREEKEQARRILNEEAKRKQMYATTLSAIENSAAVLNEERRKRPRMIKDARAIIEHDKTVHQFTESSATLKDRLELIARGLHLLKESELDLLSKKLEGIGKVG